MLREMPFICSLQSHVSHSVVGLQVVNLFLEYCLPKLLAHKLNYFQGVTQAWLVLAVPASGVPHQQQLLNCGDMDSAKVSFQNSRNPLKSH